MSIQDFNHVVWKIPDGVKANCYLFALAPKVGLGGYAERPQKSTPGGKCSKYKSKRMNFNDCKGFMKRITCDNPVHVKRFNIDKLNEKISPDNHLMCALLSPGKSNGTVSQDFHFLRRVSYRTVKNAWKFLKYKTPKQASFQFNLLKPRYVWAHQRGWSKGGPIIHDAVGNLIIDPRYANFNYGRLNYNKLCGIFKVNTRKATVDSTYNKPISKQILNHLIPKKVKTIEPVKKKQPVQQITITKKPKVSNKLKLKTSHKQDPNVSLLDMMKHIRKTNLPVRMINNHSKIYNTPKFTVDVINKRVTTINKYNNRPYMPPKIIN
jgi:hypothetical protein